MNHFENIDKENLPSHIAVIMDGNGRWAKSRGKNRLYGHGQGVKAVRATTEGCAEIGIKYLTLYAFSKENWDRPALEVSALMELLVRTLRKETKQLHDKDIRLNAIGDINALPARCYDELMASMELTKNNKRMTLTLALNYSSRWEIVEASKKMAEDVKKGLIKPEYISEQLLSNYLTTMGLPDPELMIRTSGEQRISNFLLWQMAYTELYFSDLFWPEFNKEELFKAIVEYQNRERRFGNVLS